MVILKQKKTSKFKVESYHQGYALSKLWEQTIDSQNQKLKCDSDISLIKRYLKTVEISLLRQR